MSVFLLQDQGLLGDLNQDEVIDILDVVRIVAVIFSDPPPSEYEFWAADVNADEDINVLNIVTLVNFILGTLHELCTEEFNEPCYNNYSECCLEITSHELTWEADSHFSAGYHDLELDLSHHPADIYILQIHAVGRNEDIFTRSRKMMLLK